VRDILQRHAPVWQATRPTLLTVGFDQLHHWRPNPFLAQAANDFSLKLLVLPPDPLLIDDQVFDPTRHFRVWRKRDESAMACLRLTAAREFEATMAETPAGPDRWKRVAEDGRPKMPASWLTRSGLER